MTNPNPNKETPEQEQPKPLCHYRGHLCAITDTFHDSEVDLVIIAEEMSDGTYGDCDCARLGFQSVFVDNSERFTINDLFATHYKAREAEPTVVSCMGDVECPKCANRFTVNRKHIFPQDIQTTPIKESSS